MGKASSQSLMHGERERESKQETARKHKERDQIRNNGEENRRRITVNSIIPVYDGEYGGGEADQVPDVLQSQAQPSKQYRIRDWKA